MESPPVEFLPNETLEEIFKACVDQDLDTKSRREADWFPFFPATLDTSKSPWAVSQVCRRWRRVALSLPCLWSNVDLHWHPRLWFDNSHMIPTIQARLSLQLERVGDHQPLFVSLSLKWGYPAPEHILSLLFSKSAQWTDVRISTSKTGLAWFTDRQVTFPNISHLQVHFELCDFDWERPLEIESGSSDGNGALLGLFRNCFKLRRLTLSGDGRVMPYLTSEIPWEGVTDFTTGDFTTPSVHQSFYKVLPLLQNIQTWHLAQVAFAHLRDTPREAITLPRLHTLILDRSHPPEIFNVLVTPSLRSLIFECSVHVNTLKHIHTLIAHSSCSIESLSFDEIYGKDMDNEWVNFSRDKSIRESIRNLQLPLDLLAQPRVLRTFHFAPEEDVYPLFPHLRSLTMYGDTLTSRSRTLSSEVVDMLASRRNVENLNFVVGSVSPLEMFFSRGPVDSFELTELETVSRFKELRRGGLVYSRIMD